MATKIDTPTARRKLEPRREPYWHVLGKGQAVGCRAIEKPSSKPKKPARGTWVARYMEAERKYKYDSLGELSDYEPDEQFEVACERARAYLDSCRSGMTGIVTVQTAGLPVAGACGICPRTAPGPVLRLPPRRALALPTALRHGRVYNHTDDPGALMRVYTLL